MRKLRLTYYNENLGHLHVFVGVTDIKSKSPAVVIRNKDAAEQTDFTMTASNFDRMQKSGHFKPVCGK